MPNVFYTLLYFQKPTSGTTPTQQCILKVYTHSTLVLALHGLFLYSARPSSQIGDRPRPCTSPVKPPFRLCQAIFKRKLSRTHTETFPTPFNLQTYLTMKMEHTMFRNVGIQISDAGALLTRKHTIQYEQSVQPRSTAAASRHTGCPNDAKHTFRPVNKHEPSKQLRR